MGRKKIVIRPTAALPPGGIDDAVKKFYRLWARADGSGGPDELNMVTVRLASMIEQVGKHLWIVYIESHPGDDTFEAILRHDTFERIKLLTWAEAVVASTSISTIHDLRSILDRHGLGHILDRRMIDSIESIIAWRHNVVHGMADSRINGPASYCATEELIRRVFGSNAAFVIRMSVIKAGEAAARGSGAPWQAHSIYEEAVALCDKALADGPNATVLSYRGIALAALGRHGEALEAYDRAAEIDPGNAGHHAGRGDALFALGRRGEALEAYGRAGGLDARHAPAHHGRGFLLYIADRHGEALEAYDRAAEIDPGNAGHHAGRGDALFALGRHVKALEAYDRAAEIDPGNAGHHAGRGAALAALGRHGEAQAARGKATRPARGRSRA